MRFLEGAIGFLVAIVAFAALGTAYQVGEENARQHYAPMACEARCEVTTRNGKVIKTVCPDSLGKMP